MTERLLRLLKLQAKLLQRLLTRDEITAKSSILLGGGGELPLGLAKSGLKRVYPTAALDVLLIELQ